LTRSLPGAYDPRAGHLAGPFTQVEPMDSYPSRQAIANFASVIAPNVNVRAQGVGGFRHG